MSYTFAKSPALFERAQRSLAAGINRGIRKMEARVRAGRGYKRHAASWAPAA